MRKEVGIAIFFGVLLGLAVAVVMVSKIRQIETRTKPIPTAQISPTARGGNAQTQPLNISEPASGVIVSKNSVTIKGKTSENALIIIQSPIKEMIFTSKNETFSVSFPLALGENVIQITSHPQDKKVPSQEKILKIYYLDEQ